MMDGLDQNGVKSQVRPDPEEPAQPSGPVDVEEDIFGDAGRDIVIEHVNSEYSCAIDVHWGRSNGFGPFKVFKYTCSNTTPELMLQSNLAKYLNQALDVYEAGL